jgi:arogenate dehydrogenase (NADP+)
MAEGTNPSLRHFFIYNLITMNKITIVGFGRFAKVLIRLLQDDCKIVVLTRDLKKKKGFVLPKNCLLTDDPIAAFASSVIIYAVPIGKFESVFKSHEKFITKSHLIIDTLSVKLLPAKILKAVCKRVGCRAILTHPMFGPDSAKNGLKDLPIVMSNLNAKKQELAFWKSLFVSKGLKVILMRPEEHDRLAANSQGLTHFVGRLLEKMKFATTEIDTQGAKKLHEVMEQTCNDTVELFRDLQQHNPHTMLMRENLIQASKKIIGELLPSHVEPGVVTIGIQGGLGSFNE